MDNYARRPDERPFSDKFAEGQLVDWVDEQGNVVQRCRIFQLSADGFVSYDRLLPCWEVEFTNGDHGVIAEKNLRAVRLNA